MRILIIGSDTNAYSIAKKFSQIEGIDLVFAAPGNEYIKEFATSIDISETDTGELLDFALANEINLTIVTSKDAIHSSVADLFKKNNLDIFAPGLESARFCFSRASVKKLLYKLKIPTPKFGIFDKESYAIDYARKNKYPLVIKNDSCIGGDHSFICESFQKARTVIESLFYENNKKIVIENYANSKKVTLYLITDGYSAFPLGTVFTGKIESGKILNYCSSPDSTLSYDLLSKIMNKVVYPLLDEIASFTNPYTGILGINMSVTIDKFQVLGFEPFFKQLEMQTILPLLKCNLKDLFFAATHGSLEDEFSDLPVYNDYVFSVLVNNLSNPNESIDFDDAEIALSKDLKIISSKASTLNMAKSNLSEDLISMNYTEENLDNILPEVTFYE